jgi:hypothetical protein
LCSSIARFGPSTKSRRNPSTQTNAAGHRKENGSLIAFQDGKMINLVVPYPMGFMAKEVDGRIDDLAGGWKGRGLWTTSGNRTPFHSEGGKGALPKIVHFQLRPDPLAD